MLVHDFLLWKFVENLQQKLNWVKQITWDFYFLLFSFRWIIPCYTLHPPGGWWAAPYLRFMWVIETALHSAPPPPPSVAMAGSIQIKLNRSSSLCSRNWKGLMITVQHSHGIWYSTGYVCLPSQVKRRVLKINECIDYTSTSINNPLRDISMYIYFSNSIIHKLRLISSAFLFFLSFQGQVMEWLEGWFIWEIECVFTPYLNFNTGNQFRVCIKLAF